MSAARWIALAAIGSAGCLAHYSGAAQPFEPARLTTEPGWVTAASTPTVRQSEMTDCGPAALSMVAARWHVVLPLAEARAQAPVASAHGVRLDALRDVARAHRLAAYAVAGDEPMLEYELRAGRPVILGLWRPYGGKRLLSHYEVAIAMRPATRSTETLVVTIDPGVRDGRGLKVRSWRDLDEEWRPAGRPALVVLGPTTLEP